MMKLGCTTFTDFQQNTLKEKFKVRNTERCSIISLRAFNCNCICLRVLSRPLHIKTSSCSYTEMYCRGRATSSPGAACTQTEAHRGTQLRWAQRQSLSLGMGSFSAGPICLFQRCWLRSVCTPPLPLSVTANTSGQALALVCHSNKHRQHCRSCNPDSMSWLSV